MKEKNIRDTLLIIVSSLFGAFISKIIEPILNPPVEVRNFGGYLGMSLGLAVTIIITAIMIFTILWLWTRFVTPILIGKNKNKKR
jgi:membrane glycosyltransferase